MPAGPAGVMHAIERAKFSARSAVLGPVRRPEEYSVSIVMNTQVIVPLA
jgi:hypothetical protein